MSSGASNIAAHFLKIGGGSVVLQDFRNRLKPIKRNPTIAFFIFHSLVKMLIVI
ncbi:MAG: hypothetical protein WA440_13505 [Ignavibacteriaceae bacterium]